MAGCTEDVRRFGVLFAQDYQLVQSKHTFFWATQNFKCEKIKIHTTCLKTANGEIKSRKSKDRWAKEKGQNDKQWSTKHCTEN